MKTLLRSEADPMLTTHTGHRASQLARTREIHDLLAQVEAKTEPQPQEQEEEEEVYYGGVARINSKQM